MLILTIGLPWQRIYCGTLTVARAEGEILLDAVPVGGLASSQLAAKHGNVLREAEMPYGDTPSGTFRLAGIHASGDRTALPARHYGPHGIVALQAVSGQALIAASAGRGLVLIHGGPPGPHGSLRSTAGALRLSNANMLALRAILHQATELSVLCVNDDAAASDLVYDDPNCPLGEHLSAAMLEPAPPIHQVPPPVTRRSMMRTAGAAFIIPVTFVAAEPEVAQAQSY